MGLRSMLWIGLSLLASAGPALAQGGAAPDAVILSSGGAFGGGSSLVVTADDRATMTTYGPFDDKAQPHVRRLRPGTYRKLRDHIRAHPIPRARLPAPDALACPDYGADSIILREKGRERGYVTTCPNAAISALDARLRALIAQE